MDKLGFRILRFKEGPFVTQTENPGDWTNRVVDIRNILKLYENRFDKFAFFMSFSKEGTFLTIARNISGRLGDNIAAWIYIPATVTVPDDTLLNIVQNVKAQLAAPRTDENLIHQIFSHSYPSAEFAEYIPSPNNNVFAKRATGFYPLKSIIGSNRYQSYYANFSAILIEDHDTLPIIDSSVQDLTRQPLTESVVFCPPVQLPKDVVALIDNKPFNKPIRASLGDTVNVAFRKKSLSGVPFCDILYPVRIDSNNQYCPVPEIWNWEVHVSRANFNITSYDSGESIGAKSTITYEGRELTNEGWRIPQSLAADFKVRISAKGYHPVEHSCNFLDQSSARVKLQLQNTQRTWRIELKNGSIAEMTLTGKHLPKTNECPLEGYDIDGGTIFPTNDKVWLQRAIGFGAALLLGIILFVLGLFTPYGIRWGGNDNDESPTPQQQNTTTVITEIEDTTTPDDNSQDKYDQQGVTAETISYLENQPKWNKNRLDEFGLNGLFETLNNYEIKDIIEIWAPKLANSTKFTEIVNAAKSVQQAGWKKNDPNNRYNSDADDYEITVSSYLERLKNLPNVKNNNSNQGANKNNKNNTGNTNKNNNKNNSRNQEQTTGKPEKVPGGM